MKSLTRTGEELAMATARCSRKPPTTATSCYGLCKKYCFGDSLRQSPSRSLRNGLNTQYWNFLPLHVERAANGRKNSTGRCMSK
jgi:hypothetical protein